jgi:hypothetical protein
MDGDLNFDEKDPDRFEKMHQAIDKNTALDAKTREELHKAVSEVDKDARRLGEMGNLHVMDENTMKYVLAKAKAEGNLPIIVAVDTINEPFWTDSGGGRADGSGGAHVITITDFDGKTGMAKIQNQWDKSANHDISVRDLTTAIHGNEGHKLEILDKRAAKYRSEGRPDFNMEYDVLQLKHSTGKISDAEYDQQIIALTVERAKEYLKLGKATTEDRQEEYQKATGKVVAMIKEIERKDPERAKKIKDDVRKQLA